MSHIGLGIVAVCLLTSALLVVTSKNLVRSVLWLAVTLATTAALFVLSSAPFLAGIQVLLYTGGVITLMLFGVMLTKRLETPFIENESNRARSIPAAIAALTLFGMIAWAVWKTDGLPAIPGRAASTEEIGRSFLAENLLAFEVLSVLLLAAMIGAIVIARRVDFAKERDQMSSIRREDRTA